MNEQDIGRAVRSIKTPEGMEERIISALRADRPKPRLKVLWAAIAACLLLALPAMAAIDPLYERLYSVAPDVAQYFRPVRMADEQNGIMMEVDSQMVKGGTARVLLSLRDTQGGRVDETCDLYDSYHIRIPHEMTGHCESAGFDEKTGKAFFLVTLEAMDGRAIAGDKITFSLGCFLSGKKSYEDISIPVELSKLASEKPARTIMPIGGGSASAPESEIKALQEEAPYDAFPVKGIALTGIGLVDGKLHVQMRVENRLQNDNNGYFYLKDTEGNTHRSIGSYYFADTAGGKRVDYIEDIFDLPLETLQKCTLHGSFYIAERYTEGNWQVTFPLAKAQ